MGTGREARLFAGEITHVNGAKGTQHYSAMFLHPYTLRRYDAARAEAGACLWDGAGASWDCEWQEVG